MRIMGIDPGTRILGYGVVDAKGSSLHGVAFGALRVDVKATYPERLKRIFLGLSKIVEEFDPDEVAIEQAFYGKSVSSALRMGEGRGVAIAAVAVGDKPIFEYSPAEVKRSVVGNGRAHKSQIQEMVRMLLGLSELPQPEDAADALAVAICHCNRR